MEGGGGGTHPHVRGRGTADGGGGGQRTVGIARDLLHVALDGVLEDQRRRGAGEADNLRHDVLRARGQVPLRRHGLRCAGLADQQHRQVLFGDEVNEELRPHVVHGRHQKTVELGLGLGGLCVLKARDVLLMERAPGGAVKHRTV